MMVHKLNLMKSALVPVLLQKLLLAFGLLLSGLFRILQIFF